MCVTAHGSIAYVVLRMSKNSLYVSLAGFAFQLAALVLQRKDTSCSWRPIIAELHVGRKAVGPISLTW